MTADQLTAIGLTANVLGTVLLAIAVGKHMSGYTEESRKKVYLAVIRRPWALVCGVALVIAGFLLQLTPLALEMQ